MVLITATLLSLASNSLWISYSAVAEVSTEYFDKTVNEIDLLATISFIVGIPMCLVSTYVVDVVGFRAGILLSSLLTFFGGLIRCLSTLPGINTSISLVNIKAKSAYFLKLNVVGYSVLAECVCPGTDRDGQPSCSQPSNQGQPELVPRVGENLGYRHTGNVTSSGHCVWPGPLTIVCKGSR